MSSILKVNTLKKESGDIDLLLTSTNASEGKKLMTNDIDNKYRLN